MTPNAKTHGGATRRTVSRHPRPATGPGTWEAFSEAMGGFLADILFLVGTAATAFLRWHRHHAAIRQLQGLDDRMLKDIGIERGHIVTAVQGIDRRTGGGRLGPTHSGRMTTLERRVEAPSVFGGTLAS